MKKLIAIVAVLALLAPGHANAADVEFAYSAGADLFTNYLWRGYNEGGLSFQPYASIGYQGKHTALDFGVWANLGASDWRFRKNIPYVENVDPNPNTHFVPELDFTLTFSTHGATIGFTHLYYFNGSNFFSWQSAEKILEEENSSQTELNIGYDFSEECGFGLFFTWNTLIAGYDCYNPKRFDDAPEVVDDTIRAYSSYFEIGYNQPLPYDMNIGLTVGMTPWRSQYTDYQSKFAVNNIDLKFTKDWDFDICTLTLTADFMLNTYNLNQDTWYIKAAGDEWIAQQKFNAAIGLGVAF